MARRGGWAALCKTFEQASMTYLLIEKKLLFNQFMLAICCLSFFVWFPMKGQN